MVDFNNVKNAMASILGCPQGQIKKLNRQERKCLGLMIKHFKDKDLCNKLFEKRRFE